MSERGSFVTQYIFCGKCLEAAKKELLSREKYLCSEVLTHPRGEFGIIAGKVGGLYAGEELHTFENELIPELSKIICHPMRIAVLAESGEQIFTVLPEGG